MAASRPNGSNGRGGRLAFRLYAFAVSGLVVVALGLGWLRGEEARLPPIDPALADVRSTVVLDRDGRLLRPFVTEDGRWRLPVGVDDVDPRYLDLLFAYEDTRFFTHSGIDARAVARAAVQ